MLPKFHSEPSRSISGCAENGAATRSSRQVTGPSVRRLSGSNSVAEPPSHSANRRPSKRITAVLAVLASSLLRTGSWFGTVVPAVGSRKRASRCSRVNLDVATMRARCSTAPRWMRQACTMPSPSNQCR